jgi:hypothetical protein
MKKTNVFKTGLLVAVILFLVSCNKTPQHLKIIPKDAMAVAAVNMKSIASKSIEFKDFLSMDMLKKISGNDSTINQLKNSGIDFTSSAYVFGDGSKGNAKWYAALSFALSDVSKFEATVKSLKKDISINEDKGYKYATDQSMILIYNDKMGIVIGSDGEEAALKAKAFELMETADENSLLKSNAKFKELVEKGNDVGIFVNYERVMDIAKSQSPEMTMNVSYKDVIATAAINFENGQIATDYVMYSNKELTEKFKDLYRSSVSSDMQGVQPGNVIAGASVALNSKAIANLLKENKILDDETDSRLATILGSGITLDFLTSTFSGEFILSLNGIRTKEEMKYDYFSGNLVPSKAPSPDYAVSIGISNDAQAQVLLDTLVGKGFLTDTNKVYIVSTPIGKLTMVKKKGALLILGEEAFATEYLAGKTEKLSGRPKELFAANASTFFLDISKIPGSALDLMGPKYKDFISTMPLAGVEAYFPKPEGETSTGKILVLFKDKEKNALISMQEMSKSYEKYFPTPPPSSYENQYVDTMQVMEPDTVAAAPEVLDEPME